MDYDSEQSSLPHSMVLYNNDEVEAVFKNGTCVKMSPCGANVVIPVKLPTTNCHPVNLPSQIHQRTQFVTHQYRRNVQVALEFRNRFAERVFLCQEVLGFEHVVDFYADINSVLWPEWSDSVSTNDGGGWHLVSTDECATMTLAPNRQECSIQFLCKLCDKPNRKTTTDNFQTIPGNESKRVISNSANVAAAALRPTLQDISNKLNFDTDSGDDQMSQRGTTRTTNHKMYNSPQNMSQVKTSDSLRRSYVWQIQNFSVDHCPSSWQYPLDILMKASTLSNDCSETTGIDNDGLRLSQAENKFSIGDKEIKPMTESVATGKSSDLPISLPLRCPRSHQHRMSRVGMLSHDEEEEDRVWLESRRIKVFFSSGVIFRIFWQPLPSLEIYPGDGSVLKSLPGDGQYFSFFCLRHGQRQEQLLSVKSPPPSNVLCGTHVLSSLLQRGHRLLCHMMFVDRNSNISAENVCWKTDEKKSQPLPTKPTQLVEECQADGIGNFIALSNGYVRVIFTDRTTLELQVDMMLDERNLSQHFKDTNRIRLFPENFGRVLLPNGTEMVVDLRNPGEMERYTSLAIEWANWISLPKSQRRSAYTDPTQHLDKISLVESELQRLRRFNNDVYGERSPTSPQDAVPLDGISNTELKQVLERTSAKIKDIENVLTNT
ncbi:uncharacterized protein C5orf34 homolog isoform X2 [Apostichopus japonicus]|uniref:uncharacterized protein C5orf34 homolog isoform X2 n=1 Tax=Stichopus japonicus TaxID=307972 RepID=UPI003AB4898A